MRTCSFGVQSERRKRCWNPSVGTIDHGPVSLQSCRCNSFYDSETFKCVQINFNPFKDWVFLSQLFKTPNIHVSFFYFSLVWNLFRCIYYENCFCVYGKTFYWKSNLNINHKDKIPCITVN